ncbi:MAG: hypothetical protein GY953_10930 [bacterium]|nr:hypothetical protein [bacterium]
MYYDDGTLAALNQYRISDLQTDAKRLAEGRRIQAKAKPKAPKRRRWNWPHVPTFGRQSEAH